MQRIIMHWTAGADGITAKEADSYHYLVSRDGTVTAGADPVSANIPPLVPGRYAAHTLGANSHSIGVCLDAMAGAMERPFSFGLYPITEVQLGAFVALVARLAGQYRIPVTRQTILSHAEVQPTLGIVQRGKWDICWLPGMMAPGDPVEVGDILRQRIAAAMGAAPAPAEPVPPTIRRPDIGPPVGRLQALLGRAGYSAGTPDGVFGKRTDEALRLFQRAQGLTVDGICGPKSWAALLQKGN